MKSTGTFTIGTLDGRLHRAHSQHVIDRLKAKHPKAVIDMVTVADPDAGLRNPQESFSALSTAEVEMMLGRLLDGEYQLLDIAADDLVVPIPEGIEVAAVPGRSRPFDALLHKDGHIIDEIEPGQRVGVLSLRSQLQISALWPDLKTELLLGGAVAALDRYLQEDAVDCLVIPASVAEMLGVQDIVTEIFFPEIMLPGAGQGLIALLARAGDSEALAMGRALDSKPSRREMEGELAFRERICTDQSCPMGVLAQVSEKEIIITGAIGARGRTTFNQAVLQGAADEAAELGKRLAENLLLNTTSLIDLLEADFPDGLPEDDGSDDGEFDEDPPELDDLPPAGEPKP